MCQTNSTFSDFKNILSCLALILVLACSSEQAKDSKNAQEGLPTLNDTEENFKFEPIIIAPEDKVTADKAPEEMVFIKGGCFILGNNFKNPSTRPSPARRIGTITTDLDKSLPEVLIRGV